MITPFRGRKPDLPILRPANPETLAERLYPPRPETALPGAGDGREKRG